MTWLGRRKDRVRSEGKVRRGESGRRRIKGGSGDIGRGKSTEIELYDRMPMKIVYVIQTAMKERKE